jgi:hypothetical protein
MLQPLPAKKVMCGAMANFYFYASIWQKDSIFENFAGI